MHPVCQLCHEEPATVHLTNILDGGEKRERHLCDACAEKEGILPKPVNVMAQLSAFVQTSKDSSIHTNSVVTSLDCRERFE